MRTTKQHVVPIFPIFIPPSRDGQHDPTEPRLVVDRIRQGHHDVVAPLFVGCDRRSSPPKGHR